MAICTFPSYTVGDDVHEAIKDWVLANGIPLDRTPAAAHFVLLENPPRVLIEQFAVDEAGRRMVNLRGTGYLMTEQEFPLKVPFWGFEPVIVGGAL